MFIEFCDEVRENMDKPEVSNNPNNIGQGVKDGRDNMEKLRDVTMSWR